MIVHYFRGKMGNGEQLITREIVCDSLNANARTRPPIKGDYVSIKEITYKVMQVLLDYDNNEYNAYVKEYDWED